MNCKDCEYFKILYEPLGKGKFLFDLGRAKCEKHNLIVDFANHRKLNRLVCVENKEQA